MGAHLVLPVTDWAERLSQDDDLPGGVALAAAAVVAFLVVLLVTVWRVLR
jgi:hypothetical protein